MAEQKSKEFDVKNFILRVIQYGFGLLVVAFGISVSIKSELGISPVSSFPYVFSLVSGIKFSICSSVFYFCYVGIQWIILGKNFKPVMLFQVIPALAFGFFVEASDWALAWLVVPQLYVVKLVYILIAVVLIAIGVRMYVGAKLVNMPSEGIAMALSQKFGFNFHLGKNIFDISSVTLAAILSWICLGGIFSVGAVGVGTVICALGVGYCIKIINIILAKIKPVKK